MVRRTLKRVSRPQAATVGAWSPCHTSSLSKNTSWSEIDPSSCSLRMRLFSTLSTDPVSRSLSPSQRDTVSLEELVHGEVPVS